MSQSGRHLDQAKVCQQLNLTAFSASLSPFALNCALNHRILLNDGSNHGHKATSYRCGLVNVSNGIVCFASQLFKLNSAQSLITQDLPMSTSSTALELISSAGLSPTEHLLLEYFVEKAVDPDLAAQYLMSRVHRDAGVKLEACLRSFKEDWRTLTSRCTVS